MKRFILALLIALALTSLGGAADSKTQYLFAYFKNNGETGVYFALSADGLKWEPLNEGSPFIAPGHPGELMRDAFITRGPDKQFHMVWTWDWKGTSIGYAHSADLVHWSDQAEVPLMASIPGTEHTWAPEIYWDAAKAQWMIIFSSVVEGRQAGNRIYCAYTSDFKTLSRPAIFFDPGFDSIDATILQARGQYHLIFKDERESPLKKHVLMASSRSLEGPWTNLTEPFTETWSEGPSALQVGNSYIVYFDHYRQPQRYSAVGSIDLINFHSLADQVSFPPGARHGSFLRISEDEARRLVGDTPPAKTQ